MSDESYKLEWKLEIKEELEDAGLSYRLIALFPGQSRPQLIKGTWLSAIPLEYIRDPDYRFNFWQMAEDAMEELIIAPKDREFLATKLARVVEPLTEADARAAAARDRENTELRDAFSREIKLARQFTAEPTPEREAQLRDARNYTNQAELKDHEKRKKKYQEETRGV